MFEGARVVTYWVCSRALTERKVNLGCTLQGQLHHLFESAENMCRAFTGQSQKLRLRVWMENPTRTLKELHTGTF